MDVKILRFLELSSEFCKEPEVYAVSNSCIQGTHITFSGSFGVATNITSKLEQFRNQKQSEIEKAERWL